jgi:outer membrane beta-barrel protein
MTKKAHTMKRGIALLVGCLVGIPTVSQAAQERKSPLADAPAIRKRIDLRNKRFELGVGLLSTVGQDFYNALMLNLRLGFHITDWLGVSASAGLYNLTPNWRSSFNSKLNDALQSSCRVPGNATSDQCAGASAKTSVATDKTPTPGNAAAAENRIAQVIMAPQVDLVPFTGKFSMFGKVFMNYDVYVFGGPAFVNLVSKGQIDNSYCDQKTAAGTPTCLHDNAVPYTGWKLGGNVGAGMHAFANDFVAINIEVHNLIYKNNAAGRNVYSKTTDLVSNADLQMTYNWMVGLNCMFFLPATAKVSR